MQSHVPRRHQAQWHLLGMGRTPDNICWWASFSTATVSFIIATFRSHWEVIKMKSQGTGPRVPKQPRNHACIICWQPFVHLPGRGLHICASHILTTLDRLCASVCTCSPVFFEGRSTWVGRNIVPFLIRLRGRERNQTSLAQIYQWTASAVDMQAVNNNINNCCCLFILVNFCDIRMYNNWCMWVDLVALGLAHLSSCIVRLMHLKLLTWGDLQKISKIVIGWLIERSIDVNICGLFIDWDSYSCLIDDKINCDWLWQLWILCRTIIMGSLGKTTKKIWTKNPLKSSVVTPYLLMFFAILNW